MVTSIDTVKAKLSLFDDRINQSRLMEWLMITFLLASLSYRSGQTRNGVCATSINVSLFSIYVNGSDDEHFHDGISLLEIRVSIPCD